VGSVVIPFLRKFLPVQWNELDGAQHRVYRVHARLFLQPSELGPLTPSPAGSVGGHTRCGERGWGVPIRARDRHCSTLGIYVLCGAQ
jgi:hypothetical protein